MARRKAPTAPADADPLLLAALDQYEYIRAVSTSTDAPSPSDPQNTFRSMWAQAWTCARLDARQVEQAAAAGPYGRNV